MKPKSSDLAKSFVAQARHCLRARYLPQIAQCLKRLSEEEIWWRPNSASNSVGNLVLHLTGNVRQWIISGLGGEPDRRHREQEFAERGPLPTRALLARLRQTVTEACDVLERLPSDALSRKYRIQGFEATGLSAISNVTQHFAYHAGQIIFVTKLRRGEDLGFTRLPPQHAQKRRPRGPGFQPTTA